MSFNSSLDRERFNWEGESFPKTENIIANSFELVNLKDGVENISLSISQVKDKDGVEVFLPRLIEGGQTNLFDDQDVPELSLSNEQKQRLLFCLDALNLPFLAAVNLALNCIENDLSSYTEADKSKVNLFIGVRGKPLSGKSSTLAALVVNAKIASFSMDVFSPQNLSAYVKGMSWINRPPTKMEFEREMEKIIRESKNSSSINRPQIARQSLDAMTSICQNGIPNHTLFVDTTGFDPSARNPDIFDLIATQSLEGIWNMPDTGFKLDEMWDFVEKFPDQNFKKFISQRQKITQSVRKQAIEILHQNNKL
jgi:hypothetical protein